MAEKHKKIALDFLNLAVLGKIDLAYDKYIDMNGKHHNIHTISGFSELKKAMKDNHDQFPNKEIIVKKILSDNDLVVTHSKIILKKKEIEISAVHIFRFKDEKIIEMWDIGQQLPPELVNKDGAF